MKAFQRASVKKNIIFIYCTIKYLKNNGITNTNVFITLPEAASLFLHSFKEYSANLLVTTQNILVFNKCKFMGHKFTLIETKPGH